MANFALRDLDLHFQGQTFQVAILSSKCCEKQAVSLPSDRKLFIYHQMNGPLIMLLITFCIFLQ